MDETPETGAERTPEETQSAAQEATGATGAETSSPDETGADEGQGGKSKAAAVAAGTGAAVAGVAGGIAVAARDTRRRILGIPIGKRNRFQRAAGTVKDKVQEPARKIGSRFSRGE
jgi:hypothetical protein